MDSEKQLADLKKRLQQVYQKAKVGEEWTAYMEKASKEIKPLQTAYETAKKGNDAEARAQAAKALADKKREMTVTDAHYRYLTDTLAKEISGLNEEAAALINDELPGAYALNYNGTVTELASKAPGYSFEMVDTKTINALAKTDTTLLPYKYIDGKKDVRWNTQAVNTQVLQGITQGESMKEIAARLNHVVGMDLKSAIRNARVAVSGAQNKGRMDMLRDARDKGVHTVKVWSAIHDNRTRDAHILLDGEEAEIDEPFDSELGEIMYPFDPDADPANVYNCRCRLEYKVVGFDDGQAKESYYQPLDSEMFVSERFSEEDVTEINTLFEKLDKQYGARVERVITSLARDQEEYDILYKNYVAHLLEENKGMRRATAEKRALTALGERPTKVAFELGGDMDPKTRVMTLNNYHYAGTTNIQENIAERIRKRERDAQRQEAGRKVRPLGNVAVGNQTTFIHEYGHAIDATYGVSTDPRFIEYYKQFTEKEIAFGVSEYATTNEREFLAECFLESFMGETQGEISKGFMRILEEIVK